MAFAAKVVASSSRPILVTPATLTVTAEEHAGGLIVLDRASGVTVTLPAASGTGNCYYFFIKTGVTSNANIIKVANSSDVIQGLVQVAQDGGDTTVTFEAASTADTVTMNGTTTGGLRGDYLEFEDAGTNLWRVNGRLAATGTEATPFSASV